MKISIIISILTIFSAIFLQGQTIKVSDPVMENADVKITYTVSGLRFNQSLNTSLYVIKDDGQTWIGPLKEIKGDIGPGIHKGEHTIIWSAMKEIPFINEEMKFKVQGEIEEEKVERSKYISYIGNDVTYIGLRAGIIGKIGFYGELRLNPLAFITPDFTYKDGAPVDFDKPGYYNTIDKLGYSALSVLGGLSFQAARSFHIYTGVGYGWEKYLYEMPVYSYETDSEIATYNLVDYDYNYKGFELDAGMMYKIKMILLSAGLTTINFRTFWWTAGLGICF